MDLTNESYVIVLRTKSFTERYSRDKDGWLKVSARGRTFRMTAEQVLNHLLPAVAGLKRGLTVTVEHRERGARTTPRAPRRAPTRPARVRREPTRRASAR